MYTRNEFQLMRIEQAEKMKNDKALQADSLSVLSQADKYNWIHQANWFGEPILELPQDMFAIQEIIFKTKPKYIIELGVAWGGSLLFYSTIMEAMSGEAIIGIDIYMPDDMKKRIMGFGKLSDRIKLITGSSVEEETITKVKSIIKDSRDVMVIIDSNHTHAHVLNELKLYSQFVSRDKYMIVSDTIIEYLPEQTHRQRPWGKGNNPLTAEMEFLKENDRFKIDSVIENKLLFTCMPKGYLVCVKN